MLLSSHPDRPIINRKHSKCEMHVIHLTYQASRLLATHCTVERWSFTLVMSVNLCEWLSNCSPGKRFNSKYHSYWMHIAFMWVKSVNPWAVNSIWGHFCSYEDLGAGCDKICLSSFHFSQGNSEGGLGWGTQVRLLCIRNVRIHSFISWTFILLPKGVLSAVRK